MLIAHISDLHINSFYNDSHFKRIKFLLKYISEQNPDHLIITGDITDNASLEDLEMFKVLLKKYGYINGKKLSIVIGNHDIFGGAQKAEDVFTFPEKCKLVDYNERVDEFTSCFRESFDNCFFLPQSGFFPYAKKIDDIIFIGLNSVAKYSNLSNTFGSNGEINAFQFGQTAELLKSLENKSERKIILIHHHFNKLKNNSKSTFGSIWSGIEKQTMKLRNKRRLFKLFKESNINLVLHGHAHESREYSRKNIKFLNGGATVKNEKQSVKINFLETGEGKIKIDIRNIELPNKVKKNASQTLKNEHIKLVNTNLLQSNE